MRHLGNAYGLAQRHRYSLTLALSWRILDIEVGHRTLHRGEFKWQYGINGEVNHAVCRISDHG